MANPLGLFDKQLVKVAWFDPTLQPGGWFSTDIVTTEGEAPTGVEATAALNEAADTGAAQVSVATHVTGVLVETGDSATAQASIAINAATATTEAPDTLSAQRSPQTKHQTRYQRNPVFRSGRHRRLLKMPTPFSATAQ